MSSSLTSQELSFNDGVAATRICLELTFVLLIFHRLCSLPYTPSPMSSSLTSQELSLNNGIAPSAAAEAAAQQEQQQQQGPAVSNSGMMLPLRGRLVDDIEALDADSAAAAAAAQNSAGALTTVSSNGVGISVMDTVQSMNAFVLMLIGSSSISSSGIEKRWTTDHAKTPHSYIQQAYLYLLWLGIYSLLYCLCNAAFEHRVSSGSCSSTAIYTGNPPWAALCYDQNCKCQA